MADRPTSTLTLLFTDIEGSTRLLQRVGAAEYADVLGEHHRVVRSALAACRGVEVKTEGDSFFATFGRAIDAITAVVQVQRQLSSEGWSERSAAAVRMGIHTGDVELSEGEYVGLDIHRAARIAAAAHGGQVLISETTHDLVADSLPDGVTTLDLGEHRLRDLERTEHVYQLVIEGLRSDFAPIRAPSARYELLPAETTAFVGRERELTRARELLDGTRLLTLTGTGGTGKTRLSLQLARSAADGFADGVAFIGLAAISSADLLAPTIRHGLGLGEEAGKTALDTLVGRLAQRQLLLVLDNFEQILPAASDVEALLQATERLKIVVTSRAALHVSGEQEFPVPPLAVPSAADGFNLTALAQSEAVALFVQRARAVRPDFELEAANARAIVDICRRLDGLPLAIELAASRIKLLPVTALLARLRSSLDVLQSNAADRTDRQRTLRGAISWSYDLLGPAEQALYRRLGVFVGGMRLDDAEAVVGRRVQGDTLDGLAGLVDHSLVRSVDTADQPRYAMLETLREYALERLTAEDELDETATDHADRFAGLAAEAEPKLTSGNDWLDRLEADHANIRAALSWLADHDMPRALLTGHALWRFWQFRGHLREGSSLLAELLDRPVAGTMTLARAKALIGLAGLLYWQNDYEPARRAYEEALAIAQKLGDEAVEVEVLYSLAYVRAIGRDWAGAARDFDSARTLYGKHGNALMATWALEAGGMVATLSGDHERAVDMAEESLASFRRLGDTFGQRNTLSVELRALMHLGRNDEAARGVRQVTELARAQGDITSISQSLHDAASLAAQAGDVERAAILTGAAKRIVEESGGEPPPELVNRIEAMPVLEQQLDSAQLASLLAAGRQMSNDEAIDYALAGLP